MEWCRVIFQKFEPKQPQLEPQPHGADPQGLHARPARTEFPHKIFFILPTIHLHS